jgi:hypothetical protein
MVIVGVFEADLFVTCKDFIIIVSEISGLNKLAVSAAVLVTP